MSNYEDMVAEIETIIREIETGSLPLNLLFEKFNLAVEKLSQCEDFLAKNKEQMEILIENLEVN
jgi:exodeoxyribonuclease VII small subunit